MGFELPRSTAVIDFAGGPYVGAEVTVSLDLTIDDALMLDKLMRDDDKAAMIDAMGDLLVAWNLEKGGAPIPCTAESLHHVGLPFLIALFEGMRRALSQVAEVDAPFDPTSSGGDTSAVPAN